MSSNTVYFHALPEEQIYILRQWMSHNEVFVVMLYWSPSFEMVAIRDPYHFDDTLESLGIPKRVCLGFEPPKMQAKTVYEFMKDNIDWCAFDIGELSSDGLKESQFSGSSENSESQRISATLAQEIKKATTAGMWVINPVTGAKQFYKQLRFSPGAAEFERSGKKLLSVAGWNYYQIDEP